MTPEERHLLRDPQDEDDWEWRRRIRANPRWRPIYQGGVFVVGLVMVLGGLALVPLPGPGWLIVILGIAIWASEFQPASRLLEFVKDKVRAWEQWLKPAGLVGQGVGRPRNRLRRGDGPVADHAGHGGAGAAP